MRDCISYTSSCACPEHQQLLSATPPFLRELPCDQADTTEHQETFVEAVLQQAVDAQTILSSKAHGRYQREPPKDSKRQLTLQRFVKNA